MEGNNPLSRSLPTKELNKLYLNEIKREIEDKKNKKLNERNENIKQEQLMINDLKRDIEEKRNKKINDEKQKKKEFIDYLNSQIKERKIHDKQEYDNNKAVSNATLIFGSNNQKMNDYKEKFISHLAKYKQTESIEEIIKQEKDAALYNLKASNEPLLSERLITDKDKDNLNLHLNNYHYNIHNPDYELLNNKSYIYFKNKELGQTGESRYSNKQIMIDNLMKKFENLNQFKKNENEINKFHKESPKSTRKPYVPISYENASNDVQAMFRYKKKQDQLLTKHMLDDQLKNIDHQRVNTITTENPVKSKFL